MKMLFTSLVGVSLLGSAMTAQADTIYPSKRCRVYDDTSFIQIPGQCGTILPYYPRRLFIRSWRQSARC
jgi:hypothetical protein